MIREATKDFEKLIVAMSTFPVLATLDFTKTFIMESDVSGNGIVVVLMKEGRTISFESCKLKEKTFLKPIYGKEMLVILHAIKKWNPCII